MPHFIITDAKSGPTGAITACRIHPIMGGSDQAPEYRKDGGVWRSATDVIPMIDGKDTVFALNERDGQRLPPERVIAEGGKLTSMALQRLARHEGRT